MTRPTLLPALLATSAATAALGVAAVAPAAQAAPASVSGTSSSAPATWGWTKSADHPMHHACHSYPFRYSVKAPGAKWTAELRLVGPHGGHVASAFFLSGDNPRTGVSHWKVCGTTSTPGRYTIRMKVTNYAAYSDTATVRQAKPSTFRLVTR